MSINDPIYIKYNERRETYYVSQGNETFYDNDNVFREWNTAKDAYKWAIEKFPCLDVIYKYYGEGLS